MSRRRISRSYREFKDHNFVILPPNQKDHFKQNLLILVEADMDNLSSRSHIYQSFNVTENLISSPRGQTVIKIKIVMRDWHTHTHIYKK